MRVNQQALDEVLRETGYTQLRPKQREAIEAFVSGKDVFDSLHYESPCD